MSSLPNAVKAVLVSIPFIALAGACAEEATEQEKDDSALTAFCPRALCGPGTRCSEERRRCEPVPSDATTDGGTQCADGGDADGGDADGGDAGAGRCEPLTPFCPTAFCGPNTQCNEEHRKCEPKPFCPTAFCGPGTVCNEEQRKCVAE